MKKYAVIGCGHFGAEFARLLQESEHGELAMVYSPSRGCENVSQELNCPYTHNLQDIWDDSEIYGVMIISPNYLHKEQVLAAAAAGKHIYCEKPFALNIEDAKEMVAACTAGQVTLMVGHIMHFYDGIRRVKDLIDSGEFGKILNVHVERTGWEDKKPEVSWKKMQDKSGGHLFHHIHEIDIVQWLMGLPTSVYAVGGNLAHDSQGFGDEDDVLLVSLSFGGESFATLQYGSGFRISNHIVRVNGSKMGALIDFGTATVTIKTDNETTCYPLFDDEASQKSILKLFEASDAGIIYGNASTRPVRYIQQNMIKELDLFLDVSQGTAVPEAYQDLFDGSSAVRSVTIAALSLESRAKQRVIER